MYTMAALVSWLISLHAVSIVMAVMVRFDVPGSNAVVMFVYAAVALGIDAVLAFAAWRATGRLPRDQTDLIQGGLEVYRWWWLATDWAYWQMMLQLARDPKKDLPLTKDIPLHPPATVPPGFAGLGRSRVVRAIDVVAEDDSPAALRGQIAASWVYRARFAPELLDWWHCAELAGSNGLPEHTIELRGVVVVRVKLAAGPNGGVRRTFRVSKRLPDRSLELIGEASDVVTVGGLTAQEFISAALTVVAG